MVSPQATELILISPGGWVDKEDIMKKEIILYDESKATYRKDIKGWVSSNGNFYGDNIDSQHLARWDGCTHIKCKDCGVPIVKHGYTICKDCSRKRDIKCYNEREKKPWDGKAMLYSEQTDRYYRDLEEAIDDAGIWGHTLDDMRLVICVPNNPRDVTLDLWDDCMPENDDDGACFSKEFHEALNRLNEIIEKHDPISWSPGKYALDLTNVTR